MSDSQQKAAFSVFGYTSETWGTDEEGNSNVKNNGGGRGGGRGGADDDYVFSVQRGAKGDVWISKYQIVYFVASICIMIVGALGN